MEIAHLYAWPWKREQQAYNSMNVLNLRANYYTCINPENLLCTWPIIKDLIKVILGDHEVPNQIY